MKHEPFSLKVNDLHEFSAQPDDALALDLIPTGDVSFHVLKDGQAHHAELVSVDYATRTYRFRIAGNIYEVKISDHYERLVKQLGLTVGGTQKMNTVKAPMPGLVLNILVEPGQAVQKGDALLILEAMKMENVLKATADATVKSVKIQQGAAVDKGQLLLEME